MKTIVQLSETIRDHLIKQRAKSESEHGSCKYRSDAGLMCAVGCLINDDAYDHDLEGKMSYDPIVVEALEQSGIVMDEATTAMSRSWQEYHDSSYTSDMAKGDSYSYRIWLESGADRHNPANVHNIILKKNQNHLPN
jgi:hypothetical protein